MATLSGNKIKDTYQSLIKLTDNGNLTTGAKQLTDGFGNNSPLYISTTQIGIGVTPEATYDLHVYQNAKVGGNLTITGDLTVNGTTTTVDTDTLRVEDPLIEVARNNTSSDAVDIGIYGKYAPSGTTLYAGLFRDTGDDKFKLFKSLEEQPTTTVNTSGTGYTVATLVANVEGTLTGVIASTTTATTQSTGDNSTKVATTAYVDTTAGNYLPLAGGTMSGNIAMGSNNISGGATFTATTFSGELSGTISSTTTATTQTAGDNSTKVATTAYVDSAIGGQDTLAEILANGNTTGGTDISVSGGDDIIFTDTSKAIFGGDLEIYNTGSSFITQASGDLSIINYSGDNDVKIKCDDGSGGVTTYINADGSTGAVQLNYYGAAKLYTSSTGIDINGRISNLTDPSAAQDAATKNYVDSQVGANNELSEVLANGNTTGGTDISVSSGDDIIFADSSKSIYGAGSDLQIYHDGSKSVIADVGTGALRIAGTNFELRNADQSKFYMNATDGGAINLYYDNSKKFETTSGGITVTGQGTVNNGWLVDNGTTTGFFTTDANDVNFGASTSGKGLKLYSANTVALTIDSSQNATFAGTVLIDGVSNYTGLEVKGVGASRPSVNLSNANTGILGQVYATENSALVFATTTSGTTALTLNASQNATFAGTISSGDITIEDTNPNLTLSDTSTTNLIHEIKSASDKLQISADSNNVDAGTKIEFYTDGVERLEIEDDGQVNIISAGTVTNPCLTIGDDVNTGIWRPASDTFAISTGGNERMRIGSNGNIDFTANLLPTAENAYNIGSASLRWEDLYVDDGYIRNAYIDEYIYHNGDADTYIRVLPDEWIFRTGGSDRFTISSANTYFTNTNVGIGTTSPDTKLQVYGTSAVPSVSTTFQGGIFSIEGTSTVYLDMGTTGSPDYYAWMQAHDASTGVNYNLAINPLGGSVGIGTDSPGAKLHVDDSSADAIIRLSKGSSTIGNIDFVNEGNRFSIQDDGARRLVIDTSGNIGIGITSPSRKLEVNGTSTFYDNMYISSSKQLQWEGGNYWTWRVSGTQFQIYRGDTTDVPFLVDTSGRVGIGTLSPDEKLDITGGYLKFNGGDYGLKGSASLTYNPVSDHYFQSSGSTKVTFKADGKVGVGITSPQKNLQIFQAEGGVGAKHATIRLGGYSTVGPDIAAYRVTGNSNDQGLIFSTYDATNGTVDTMTLTNAGNVGIGTTAPGYKLDVNSDVAGDWVTRIKNDSATGYGLYVESSSNAAQYMLGLHNGNGYQFIVNGAGNVGIGETNPSAKLEVNVGGGSTAFMVKNSSGLATYNEIAGGYSNLYLYQTGGGAKVVLASNGNSYFNGGNLGIGLTNPSEKLDVNGRVKWVTATGGDIYLFTGSKYYLDGGSNTYIVGESPDGDNIGFVTGGSTAMTIDENQAIGIGVTSSFGSRMHVKAPSGTADMIVVQTGSSANSNVGAIVFRDDTFGFCGQITVNGSTNTTSYVTGSDYRLKQDYQDFNGLDLVSNIPVYDFQWKKSGTRAYGVQAHELQEVLPQAVVGEKDGEDMQQVDYSKIVPILLKSIQELKQEIETLKTQINK